MDFKDRLICSVIILIIVVICAAITTCFLPRPHQGYYMFVKDGSNGNQIYPIFRVCNNWRNFPDDTAFESLSATECFEMFKKLEGGINGKAEQD